MKPNIDPSNGIRIGFCSGHPYADLMDRIQREGTDDDLTRWALETANAVRSQLAGLDETWSRTRVEWEHAFVTLGHRLFVRLDDRAVQRLSDLVDVASGTFDLEEVCDAFMTEAHDNLNLESAHWTYDRGGVRICLSTSNGPCLAIEKSTHVVPCRLCSPCCPNGGDLDHPDEYGFLTYCIPPELATTPYKDQATKVN